MQSRSAEEKAEQERIKRKIAELQASLLPSPERTTKPKLVTESNGPVKRVLVAGSPESKKRKIQHVAPDEPPTRSSGGAGGTSKTLAAPAFKPPSPPRKSNIAAATSAFQANRASRIEHVKEPVQRSTSFSQPAPIERTEPTRHEDMTVKEELPIGPIDHPAPFDDPRWERIEPYSGMHLTSRKLPYDEFQEFMYGRVYLSPSRLYSVVRLSPDRSAYDVPIDGDWVTIAVVAERGQVQISRRGGKGKDNKEQEREKAKWGAGGADGAEKGGKPQEKNEDDEDIRPTPKDKKYMRLLLVDFGHRASEAKTTSKEQLKGDALLNMLLFEADSVKTVDGDNGKGKGKNVVYKGGSGGAFEQCAKLREGAILAILNPRVLKPFQRSAGNPHPRDNALAITPENASSIAVLGYSRDLGSCRAVKRDGKPCGSWCDKRISDVCEYHIQETIKSRRAARPEFTAGTADLTTTSNPKSNKFGKQPYDPTRKWGLLPSVGQQNAAASSESAKLGGGATYIVDGRVLSSAGGPDAADVMRLKGVKKKKEEEWALEEVLRRDGGKTAAANILRMGAAHLKAKRGGAAEDVPISEELEVANDGPKKTYSAELVKSIGYNPSKRAKNGRPKEGDGARQLVAADRTVELRPPPGRKRFRSNVKTNFAPPRAKDQSEPNEPGSGSDSELEIEG